MFQKVLDFPRNVKYGVQNLVKWFPVIWKDRQWDNHFIYYVLRHKLHLTEQNTRKYGYHVNNIKDADKIKKCVNLLDRLIEDDYHGNVFRQHNKKWGRPNFDIGGDGFLDITHPNVITEEDEKQERKEYRRLTKEVDKMENQDIELLFKLMGKHIRTWWD